MVGHGRYDTETFIRDLRDKEILALPRHVIYVRPFKAPLGGNGSGKRRKESKI